MKLLRFIAVVEKIGILIILLCFVPISVQVFSPNLISVSKAIDSAYILVLNQAAAGFVTQLSPSHPCSKDLINSAPSYCFTQCQLNISCLAIWNNTCPFGYISDYTVFGVTYCLNKSLSIGNELNYSNLSLVTIAHNPSLPPLFNAVTPYYYVSGSDCSEIAINLGKSINQTANDLYKTYNSIMIYLFWFGLLPVAIHVLLMLFLDECCKSNFRQTNSLLVVHICTVSVVLIVVGVNFHQLSSSLVRNINLFGTNCMSPSTDSNNMRASFVNFNPALGSSDGYMYFMLFILVLLCLCIFVVLFTNIFMKIYYRLRDHDPSSSGYELQSF